MSMTATQAQQLYVAYFNRPADTLGLAYWTGKPAAAASLEFSKSAEYAATYAGMSTAARVDAIYTNLFGRAAEPAGLKYWGGLIESGLITVSDAVTQIAKGAQGTDLTAYNNKVKAAEAFTTALDTTAEIVAYSGTTANAAAKTWLTGITTDATLTAATTTAALNASIVTVTAAAVVVTAPVAFTTGVDNLKGTTGNDVFTAVVDSVAPAAGVTNLSTLSAVDGVAGDLGADRLDVTFVNGAAALPTLSISGVETIAIRNVAGAVNVDAIATNYAGVTNWISNLSTGNNRIDDIATGATVTVVGNGTLTNGNLAFAHKTTTAAVNLVLDGGVTAGTITNIDTNLDAAGAATTNASSVTITSQGAANTTGAVDLSATANSVTSLTVNANTDLTAALVAADYSTAASLTVTGAGAVDLGANFAGATVVASTNSGGLTMAGNANLKSYAGSTGADVFTAVAAYAATTAGMINGGTGTDVLDIATLTHVDSAAEAAVYTGFEVVRTTGAGSFDQSLISGLTGIQTAAGNGNVITNMTATSAANVQVRTTVAANGLSFALADSSGSSDALTVAFGTAIKTGAATDITGGLTAAGFETINLKTNNGSTATAGANKTTVIDSFTVDKATAINLTGNSFDLTSIATTKAVTIDGSQLKGDGSATPVGLTVAGNGKAGSTVIGSDFKDSFTIGAEGTTYNAGAGNDTITIANTVLTPDGTTDTKMDGGAGTDTLTITNAMTLTDTDFTYVSGMEKLSTGLTTAVSVTGLAGGAKAAFATGIEVTSGTLANDVTYTWGSGLYDKNVTLTLTSDGVGNTNADSIVITTGSGADSVTVTAASWVGHANTNGRLTVSTGAGDDTITVSTGTLLANANAGELIQITGGTGKDVITVTHVNNAAVTGNMQFVVAAGDSTVSSYDSITGFKMSDVAGAGGAASDGIDFASKALTTYAATTATGFSAAELTVAVSAAGVVTFAGTSASALTLAQKISAVQSVVTTNAGDSALFTHGTNSYVFNNNSSGDSVVELVGITGAALLTTNDATTDNGIFIF